MDREQNKQTGGGVGSGVVDGGKREEERETWFLIPDFAGKAVLCPILAASVP